MSDDIDTPESEHEDHQHGTVAEYLERAMVACADGDAQLGMHLYLAAFEEGTCAGKTEPCEEALVGLKRAWSLACMQKERSMAEYIFEKMEPYLDSDEIAVCANELQSLALDKLEEFGLSREDLEDMAEMITQDFLGGDMPILHVEHGLDGLLDLVDLRDLVSGDIDADIDIDIDADDDAGINIEALACELEGAQELEDAPEGDSLEEDSLLDHKDRADVKADSPEEASFAKPCGDDIRISLSKGVHLIPKGEQPADAQNTDKDLAQPSSSDKTPVYATGDSKSQDAQHSRKPQQGGNPMEVFAHAIEGPASRPAEVHERLDYSNTAGYGRVIEIMHDLGIGMRGDEDFQGLVDLLNKRHGLASMPAVDSLLFRAPVHEDANRFVAATIGELKLPALRMSMEENLQGMPVLCVMVQSDNAPKLNSMRTAFEGGGVLFLEDIDTWGAPFMDIGEEAGNFLMMQLSRGAREAVNLIRSAVDNPDVYVLATASTAYDVNPYFLDLLDPVSFIDIDNPDDAERDAIWTDIVRQHPSMRALNRADLVRLSANMPRFDIYMAAREAVEEAYKTGLAQRGYQPVTRDNVFDKLAAYQPLESDEYHELEDSVISDFHLDLDNIDDLLQDDE